MKSCEFSIDTTCVDVKLTEGSMASINCDTVESISYTQSLLFRFITAKMR
ncbi:MAG: DUF6061 family protein [Acutalibacteraceae bacterium]